MTDINIGSDVIGTDERPYVVAEAGTNFRDDIELAKRLIEEAAAAGADAVKFQTHLQAAEMVECAMRELGLGDLYERIGQYSLTSAEHRELKTHCDAHGVTFLSTPFSVEGVERLEEVGVPAIKIGSGELTNFHLLDQAAQTEKPLLISTGMADMETVRRTHEFVSERTDSHAFLYCISEYPTEPERFEFGVIQRTEQEFGVPVGFSDHSRGVGAPALAMARGAALVEKHFTLDRRLPGGDQEVSLEPEELERLVRYARLVSETDGNAKRVSDEESDVAEWARHSVVTTTQVEKGEALTRKNTTTKRPGTGIPARQYFEVLGARALRDIPANTPLEPAFLEDT